MKKVIIYDGIAEQLKDFDCYKAAKNYIRETYGKTPPDQLNQLGKIVFLTQTHDSVLTKTLSDTHPKIMIEFKPNLQNILAPIADEISAEWDIDGAEVLQVMNDKFNNLSK